MKGKRKNFGFALIIVLISISSTSSGPLDDFTLNLYRTILRFNRDENLVISPSVIASAVGMAMNGASAETRYEIEAYLNANNDELQKLSQQTLDVEDFQKLFLSHKYSIKQSYQQSVARIFRSTAESLNFSDPSTVERKVNAWVSEETHGAIKEMKFSVTNETLMLLMSAAQFSGTLLPKFQFSENHRKVFHLDLDDPINVDYLMLEDEFNYYDYWHKDMEVLEIPYRNSNLSLLILLPYEPNGLQAVEDLLTVNRLARIMSKLERQPVTVEIPKFKIDTEISLKVAFERMGVKRMFGPKAQFTNIVRNPAELKVSEIYHKAAFELGVNGTIPIIETTTARPCIGCEKEEKTTFVANRPFLFIVRNPEYIFFIGRVLDPDFYKPLWYLDQTSGRLLPYKHDV